MRKIFLIALILNVTNLFSQTYSLSGIVFDDKAAVIPYATTALLDPADSTLSYYAVTNSTGTFEIKNIKPGTFILQTSFLGFKTKYSIVKFPEDNITGIRSIVLEQAALNLPAANVNGERIPLLIRGDTIEYNASSYKTKPDAVTEDLLKKLPGVEVDRNGNIKAQGEEVKKVTVDGKEFFGNDPKIATRNLPADAINKVQVFDTKSDQAELTGINDGKRDKTINLQLKDDHKSAWFGEMLGGYGSDDHYQMSAKAYRFNPTKQFAFLGMFNNINKFGFSFSDYMDFSGGLRNGGSLNISSDGNNFPIDFGDSPNGLLTSGAGGANFSSVPRKDNKFNISYLANGIDKKLNENNFSTNYTGAEIFYTNKNSFAKSEDRAHRLNFGWKNRIDTMNTLNLSGQMSLSSNNEMNSSGLSNYNNVADVSAQQGQNIIDGNILNGNVRTNYLKKMNSNWKLLNIGIEGSWLHGLSKNEIKTLTKYYSPPTDISIYQIQNNNNDVYKYSAEAGITRRTGAFTYVEGRVSAGREDETFSRTQGLAPESDGPIDSLSADLKKLYEWIEPKISFKRILVKSQMNVSLAARYLEINNEIKEQEKFSLDKLYFLPSFRWENEYKKAHRILFSYEASVVAPTAREFFPVTNYFDPLNQIAGNQKLKQELHNDFRFHWSVFDQFSFSSIFAGARFSYVKNKIGWEKSIDNNLVQKTTLINVPEDYRASLNAEYSTPIRKLGVNISISADETWSKTLTSINGLMNSNSSLAHQLEVTFDNRKKNKWDVSAGLNIRYDRSLYSLPTVDKQTYVKGGVFTDINFNPNDNWHFSVKADLSRYYGEAFNDDLKVPLLQAEASFLFLKHKRGALILTGFDLLNRNTGYQRTSEYNILMESKSDIIQRYVMLTFRYKLNKFSSGDNVDVKINGH